MSVVEPIGVSIVGFAVAGVAVAVMAIVAVVRVVTVVVLAAVVVIAEEKTNSDVEVAVVLMILSDKSRRNFVLKFLVLNLLHSRLYLYTIKRCASVRPNDL